MAATERNPNNIEAIVAGEVITGLAIREDGLKPEEAGDILAAIHQSQDDEKGLPPLTTRQIRVTKFVLGHLQKSGRIPEEEAEHTLALLAELTPAGPLMLSLNDAIEEVTEHARQEVRGIIGYESQVDNKRLLAPLSTLEKAVYNLGAVDGWRDEGTWLGRYLSRREVEIVMYKPFPILSYASWRYVGDLTFTQLGIVSTGKKVTEKFLEEAWDKRTGNILLVRKMAGLERGKFAGKVLRAIS